MVKQKQVNVDANTPRLRLRGVGVAVDNGATTDAQYPDIRAGDFFIAAPFTSHCGVEHGDIVIALENNATFDGADFSPGGGWLVIGYGSAATGLSAFKQALTNIASTVSTQGTDVKNLFLAVAANDNDISALNAKFPIDETELSVSLAGTFSIGASIIDWSAASVFTKTLASNTTLSFTGLDHAINKTITLIISGNYTLGLPSTVKIISGEYDTSKLNYIQIHCVYVDTEVPSNNQYWCVISQEA